MWRKIRSLSISDANVRHDFKAPWVLTVFEHDAGTSAIVMVLVGKISPCWLRGSLIEVQCFRKDNLSEAKGA